MTRIPSPDATPALPANAGFLRHRVGDIIKERYRVLEPLGGGSFGTVYRVLDEAVGVELACKEMHVLDDINTPNNERATALEWFKREALNLATVRHPHIPAAYFEQEDGAWRVCPQCGLDFPDAQFCPDHGAPLLPVEQRFYLMMDFIDGPTLEEMAVSALRDTGRPLEENTVVRWIEQIGGALRALHRVGIVHRDIKPENIKIRTTDDAAVLLDFGLTRKAEEAGGYGTLRQSGTGHMGTPGYAPPDLQELTHPEARSDIYALGMTLYRLLSGRDPQTADDLAQMRAHPPRFFNNAISPATEAIIARAIQANRNQRFGQIDDLLDELKALRGDAHPAATPFIFADGVRARTPQELLRLIETRRDEAANYLWNGMLERWLLSAGYAAGAQAAVDSRTRWPQHAPRALEWFRRALQPQNTPMPLPEIAPRALDFGVLESGQIQQLTLRIAARDAYGWGNLFTLLQSGPRDVNATDDAKKDTAPREVPGLSFAREWENQSEIVCTLDTSRLLPGDYAGEIIVRDAIGSAPNGAGTIVGRVPLRFRVRALNLRVQPAQLEFGTVAIGQSARLGVRILNEDNSSRGIVRGAVHIAAGAGPVSAPEQIEGEKVWQVEIDATRPDAMARHYESALNIDSNGGRLRVPLRYRIVLPPLRIVWLLLSHIALAAVGAGLGRFAYAIINPAYAMRWLSENGTLDAPQIAGFGAPLLLGALIGLTIEIWRNTGDGHLSNAATTQRSSTPRGRFNPLLQSLLLSAIIGAIIGWPLLWLGHWLLWGSGDWLLRPLNGLWIPLARALHMDIENIAPFAWATSGGIFGALWGIGRVMTILNRPWARYAVLTIYGLIFLILLVAAMLFTG